MPPKKSTTDVPQNVNLTPPSKDTSTSSQKVRKGKSKGNKRDDDLRILQRRKRVAQLYCEGKSQFEISKITGMSQPMISVDLKVIRDAWLATAVLDWDDVKAKELAKLDLIEERMWEAYHRTYGEDEIKTVNIKKAIRDARIEQPGRLPERLPAQSNKKYWNSDIDGPKFKHVPDEDEDSESSHEDGELQIIEETINTRTKQLPGDPAFMDRILKCIEMRCKILGFLDDKNVNNNIPIGQIDWDAITAIKTAPDPIEARINKLVMIEPVSESKTPVGSVQEIRSSEGTIQEIRRAEGDTQEIRTKE